MLFLRQSGRNQAGGSGINRKSTLALLTKQQGIQAIPNFVFWQCCQPTVPNMHMDAILRITAILQANTDGGLGTDKLRLVDDLQIEFPEIARDTLFELVEQSIATIGGRAI